MFLGDPPLPFVVLHNEIHLRPKSFVRVPVRFVPVIEREYEVQLIAQIAGSGEHFSTILSGRSI